MVLGQGDVVAVGRVEELLPEAQRGGHRVDRKGLERRAVGDDGQAAVSRVDVERGDVLAVALLHVELPVVPHDAFRHVARERPHERGLHAVDRVDDQDVLAVAVDHEREPPVVGERDRVRTGDDVADGSSVSRVRDDRQPRELRARLVEDRERREDGSLEVELRLGRVRAQHHVGHPQIRGTRADGGVVEAPDFSVGLGRVAIARGRSVGDGPRRRERERLRAEGADARAEQVRRVEGHAVRSPGEAPRLARARRAPLDPQTGGGHLDDRVVLRAGHEDVRVVTTDDDTNRLGADHGAARGSSGGRVDRVEATRALSRDEDRVSARVHGERARRDGGIEAHRRGVGRGRLVAEEDFVPYRARRRVEDADAVGVGMNDEQESAVAARGDGARVRLLRPAGAGGIAARDEARDRAP